MMPLNLGFLFMSFIVAIADNGAYLGDRILENPDLLGGDILEFEDIEDRTAIVGKHRLWPGGIIPYETDPGLKKIVSSSVLATAMSFYEKDTCIKFVPRTTEKDYVRIFPGEGCYSHVGRIGGAQNLSLGLGCGFTGIVTHELGHVVGFYHEQNRSDRDDYIIIYWNNIEKGMENQFFKLQPHKNQLLTPFDYDSIMLYGTYSFTKDRRRELKTMLRKDYKPIKDVILKYWLSKDDVTRIKMLYNC